MQQRTHIIIDSPLDALTLVATGGRLSGLYMVDQRHRPPAEAFGERDPRPFADVTDQLAEYFAEQRTSFDLALALIGTPFRRAVWDVLRAIPYGETWSYRQVAYRLGRPAAARAVGLANGANTIGIVVPCHRVVGSDGSLTGYGGGLDRKRHLLDAERRRSAPALFERAPRPCRRPSLDVNLRRR